MKNKKKILLYAVNALLIILIGVCILRSSYYSNVFLSQQTAKYWAGDSKERFSQVSCFFPVNKTVSIDTIFTFRNSIDKKLVEAGVLKKVAYQEAPPRYEYRLTSKGRDLHGILMAIVHWGDVHMSGKSGRPLQHRHTGCGHLFDPVTVCSHCSAPITAKEVTVERGPGA